MAQPQRVNANKSFVIDGDKKASWALRKIKKLKKEQNHHQEIADHEIDILKSEITEVNDWLKQKNKSINDSISFFEGLLYEYALTLKKDDPDLKTHKLPYGKLQFRKKKPKWNYQEEKLLNFIKNNYTQALKIKESIDKRKLRQVGKVVGDKVILEETGQVIEGIDILPRGEQFRVKVNT